MDSINVDKTFQSMIGKFNQLSKNLLMFGTLIANYNIVYRAKVLKTTLRKLCYVYQEDNERLRMPSSPIPLSCLRQD
jgi:hypothetical protein